MGEMSKVEEVALAIATALQKSDRSAHVEPRPGDEAITVIDGMFDLKAVAKAAIAAMRKPTLAMCEVAREEAPNSEYDTFDDELMTKWYQSVIDEALKE